MAGHADPDRLATATANDSASPCDDAAVVAWCEAPARKVDVGLCDRAKRERRRRDQVPPQQRQAKRRVRQRALHARRQSTDAPARCCHAGRAPFAGPTASTRCAWESEAAAANLGFIGSDLLEARAVEVRARPRGTAGLTELA